MKKILLILVVILTFSCSSKEKNPTGLNPENMTEEELYMHYGLEAPTDVYNFIYDQLENDRDFASACQKRTVSNFIAVDIVIDNFKITEVNTRFSDY